MGYDETTNLKLKKPTIGTSKTEWPGYVNGNFDTIDTEMANRHKKTEDVVPDQDNARSIGSAIRRFLGGFFNEITLGGVTRSTWPQAGSGSQSMDDVYDNGSVVSVDNTDEVHKLGSGKKFKLANADGTVTYMEAEGGKGITFPGNDVRQNLLPNSQFAVWSNATLENVGGNLITNGSFNSDTAGWTPTNCTLASVAGGQSGNCLQITLTSGSVQFADSTSIGTVAGKLYRATVYVESGTGGTAFMVQVFDSAKTNLLGQISGDSTASWVQTSIVFKATDSASSIRLIKRNATAGTMLFDEVVVCEVTPGCLGTDSLAMDGWAKTSGALVYRQHGDSAYAKEGSFYSLKMVGGPSAHQVSSPGNVAAQDLAWIARFKGRVLTFGCWAWCASPFKARISIYDTQHNYSAYHSGNGAWEWLEITRTVPMGTMSLYVSLFSGTSTTAYFSQPHLVFGASIGAGNYIPRLGEIIWVESPAALLTLDNKTALSTVAATTMNLEADALGMIGKGARAIYLSMASSDSGSAGGDAQVNLGPTSANQPFSCSPTGLANSKVARAQGWISIATDGTMVYVLSATGTGTLNIQKARIMGVQF